MVYAAAVTSLYSNTVLVESGDNNSCFVASGPELLLDVVLVTGELKLAGLFFLDIDSIVQSWTEVTSTVEVLKINSRP